MKERRRKRRRQQQLQPLGGFITLLDYKIYNEVIGIKRKKCLYKKIPKQMGHRGREGGRSTQHLWLGFSSQTHSRDRAFPSTNGFVKTSCLHAEEWDSLLLHMKIQSNWTQDWNSNYWKRTQWESSLNLVWKQPGREGEREREAWSQGKKNLWWCVFVIPALGQGQEDLWGLLVIQPSLVVEPQADKRPCH